MAETHVLFVEDDDVIREATQLALERVGFTVTAMPDGLSGLEAFRADRPDIALLDVMVPGLDGVSLCRRIRDESTVPVIMLSARADSIDVVLGLEAGADDYVTKPFDGAVLVAASGPCCAASATRPDRRARARAVRRGRPRGSAGCWSSATWRSTRTGWRCGGPVSRWR
ncbi:Response regulatory domain-containing protein OS=Streptomyces microflavus OX=1919 GN=Smic_33930 PE=4 SV=1 [Streptomyces microflavus]